MHPTHVEKHEVIEVRETAMSERSLGELFGELSGEVKTLIQQEMALAKAEMSAKASKAAKNAGKMAAGGALAYAGLIALLGAVAIILTELGMALWLSSLLVALVAIGVGAWLAKSGLDTLRNMDYAPRRTIETIKETTK